jgi:hypothetical protein
VLDANEYQKFVDKYHYSPDNAAENKLRGQHGTDFNGIKSSSWYRDAADPTVTQIDSVGHGLANIGGLPVNKAITNAAEGVGHATTNTTKMTQPQPKQQPTARRRKYADPNGGGTFANPFGGADPTPTGGMNLPGANPLPGSGMTSLPGTMDTSGGGSGWNTVVPPKGSPMIPVGQKPSQGGNASLASRRRRALIAEPDHVWSKSPSTTKIEFANRVGAGVHPEDAYRAIIAEITDHHGQGLIDNRDAHRAANEAFGRLLFSRKQPRQAARKQGWQGWGPDSKPKRHKVSGWSWDQHLNGYVSNSHRKFQCSCGAPVNVPDYHRCKCGRTWNSYVVGTGGDRHQAAAEKFIAREVPERGEMLVASKQAVYTGYDDDISDYGNSLYDPENQNKGGFHHRGPSNEEFSHPMRGMSPNQIGPGVIHHHARDDLKFPTGGYDDYDPNSSENNPDWDWPSDHHPDHGKELKSTTPDWFRRDTRTQQWTK